jgi:23S rRNA (cytosine1962-C5)-methyltransferase
MDAFENRLRKNFKHWSRWARRRDLGAFRVYDRDVPEFPVIVEYYGDRFLVQFLERKDGRTEAPEWRASLLERVCVVGGCSLDSIATRIRFRQTEGRQYEKIGEKGSEFQVAEGGYSFLVNLEDYLDTGLFLDHRETRQRVGSISENARFLNLFAYTGSFTVYAAGGGAKESVSVDLSNTYLDWAKRNFETNKMDLSAHRLVREDVYRYLKESREDGELFDLIVCDPPTFSHSKKVAGSFDVQRDHQTLVMLMMDVLAPGGSCFFSTNRRGFKLDEMVSERNRVVELTPKSIPDDFRNRRMHRCWQLNHLR